MKKTLALFLALLMTLSLGLALMEAPGSALDEYLKPREDIRNIIILIPDGMSPGGITLARWYKSYQADTDSYDPSVTLALDEMASGVIRTYWQTASVLGAITDSAPAGTAFATGHKTNDKHIAVNGDEEIPPGHHPGRRARHRQGHRPHRHLQRAARHPGRLLQPLF
ncbi:MAG TPA: alkaline phosphatase [Clostridia bacterium]|nr:alkaline phosphatase [Clostridia bacterium]